jgi:hypothetical protein
LTYQGYIYALTVVIVALFIYRNLHDVIGTVLFVISIIVIVLQFMMALLVAYCQSDRLATGRLLAMHYWLNHFFLLSTVPFLIWATVVMCDASLRHVQA